MAIVGGLVLGLGLSGILYSTETFKGAGPPLLIATGGIGLGIGLMIASLIRGE
jgi:hypothetical protein